jgi:putative ABC transport system permease protein
MQPYHNPPAILRKLLAILINVHYLEEIEGDLHELFNSRCKDHGRFIAIILYARDVLRVSATYRSRRSRFHKGSYRTMPVLNLMSTVRSLLRQPLYTTINIWGLSLGLASCAALTLYVTDELSFDKQFDDHQRIYKLVLERTEPGKISTIGGVPHSYASVIPEQSQDAEMTTAISGPFNGMMITLKRTKHQSVNYLEDNVYAADSNFFSVFSFPIIKGNRTTMLKEPKSMVLTETVAKKYFGESDPMGMIIHMSGDDFVVTGVCADPPDNTHFNFGIVISIHTIERFTLNNFNRPDSYCYIKLLQDVNPKALEERFRRMVELHAGPEFEQVNASSWKDYLAAGNGHRYFLVPLKDVYLYPINIGGFRPPGNIVFVQVLILVIILIFAVTCINFVNLSTARAASRAKEVGIRKIIGSRKSQLIFQFLIESWLTCLAGVLIAILLLYLLLPAFNELSSKRLLLSFDFTTVVTVLMIWMGVGLLAGIYPAFVLSSFQPISVIKGKFVSTSKGKWVRNNLVIFQFAMSVVLAISTLVIFQQVKYLGEKDLGYDKEQLLIIEGDFHMRPDFTRSLIDRIKSQSQVHSVAGSLSLPSHDGIFPQQYTSESSPTVQAIRTMIFGDNFAEVMGLKLKDGSLFSEQTKDSLSILLNEKAVKAFGFTDPIGKKITYIEQTYGSGEQVEFTVIGVVKDFNFKSLHESIEPLIIQSNEQIYNRVGTIAVRIRAGQSSEAVKGIEQHWKELSPDTPFEFKFMDTMLNEHYQKERQTGKLASVFAILSLLIACIGLFGLSAYTVSTRTREIGIRKVVGANTKDIFLMLSYDFTKLVLVAFFIAAPLSWYVMESWWLNQFAFRVELSPILFGMIGILILGITWFTVGFHSVKASIQKPVDSIRDSN